MTDPAAAASAPFRDRFDRPIFIVSTPRSGSTLLFETLEQAPGLCSTGYESHFLIEAVSGLAPADRGWSSNRLTAEDATPERAEALASAFYEELTDRDGQRPQERVRMLEKTPKNALRVAFFDALWPDALFVYLYRDVRETLFSMGQAWQSGAFLTYPDLPGWSGPPWSLLLVPGWEKLSGLPLPEIVAHQWAVTTDILVADLGRIDPARLVVLDYGEFLAAPQQQVERLAEKLGLAWDRQLERRLPLSKTTVTEPRPDKWRAIEPLLPTLWPIVGQADARARAFIAERQD